MSGIVMTGLTDPGKVRPENEDSIATHPELGLAVLADGMGGHQAGEVASGMAVEVVARHFADVFCNDHKGNGSAPTEEPLEIKTINEAIQLANSAIYEVAQARPDCSGMGSTIVIAVFYDDKLCIGHVGDSRLYRYRNNALELLTEDHSVVQELLNRGLVTPEEARTTIGKNLVTRALGVDPVVTPDVSEQTIAQSDIYLLCSDGLNDVIADRELQGILGEFGANLEEAAQRLINLANERGGPDNISVILARTDEQVARHGGERSSAN